VLAWELTGYACLAPPRARLTARYLHSLPLPTHPSLYIFAMGPARYGYNHGEPSEASFNEDLERV
jgi:hypothetical protein